MNTASVRNAPLEAIRQADFNWVTRLDDIWADLSSDGFLHGHALAQLLEDVDALLHGATTRPGRVIQGIPGSGKTHLLRHLRGEVARRCGFFVLVDCTDVRDFWPTVMFSVAGSLHRELHTGWSQWSYLRFWLSRDLFSSEQETAEDCFITDLSTIQQRSRKALNLLPRDPAVMGVLSQTILAVFLTACPDRWIQEQATMWVQGTPLDEEAAKAIGLPSQCAVPKDLLKTLTWLCGQFGPVIIAFDQLDPLISQHHSQTQAAGAADTESVQRARAILQGVGGGLMGLFDATCCSLTVVSCLKESWDYLAHHIGTAPEARFQLPPIELRPITTYERASAVICERLAPANEAIGAAPPYPTYPFDEHFLNTCAGDTARELLRKCDAHRRFCLERGEVVEASAIRRPDVNEVTHPDECSDLNADFDRACCQTDISAILGESNEDGLGDMLCRAFALLRYELEPPPDVDLAVDSNFIGGRSYPTLHARLRLVFRREGDREFHVCIRALEKTNHSAFRARLNAALVESGIDRKLPFRKLFLLRTASYQFSGPATMEMIQRFQEGGGVFLSYKPEDVAMLSVLLDWEKKSPAGFEAWLRHRQPLASSRVWGRIVDCLLQNGLEQKLGPKDPETSATQQPAEASREEKDQEASPLVKPSESSPTLPLGRAVQEPDAPPVTIPLAGLTKHIIIRAGSGGGKTVLIKRLVEEAALRGVSSVVLDPGNDLTLMACDWPDPPSSWLPDDPGLLKRLRRETDVCIYTPGRSDGRPLNIPLLPDLTALRDDADDLQQAVESSVEALASLVAPGKTTSATHKKGILASALHLLASRTMPPTLASLANLLEELPPSADPGIPKAERLAAEMAGSLRAAIAQKPSIDPLNHLLNWKEMFGLTSGRPRISIVNFCGMPAVETQQQWLNSVALSLFAWIKQNPSAGPSGLTGLLVLDEAKEFLPAGAQSSPCKKSLMRLTTQARKYGLGLVFATQNPKDLDYNAVAQFSTQYFGRANAPQVIEFIQKLLQEKGASTANVARLQRGEFFVCSGDGHTRPVKVNVPLCLTHHPDGRPPTEAEVLRLVCGT